jgi:tetrahydromethanopterin S-methyltransferase subunit F
MSNLTIGLGVEEFAGTVCGAIVAALAVGCLALLLKC